MLETSYTWQVANNEAEPSNILLNISQRGAVSRKSDEKREVCLKTFGCTGFTQAA